MSAETIFALSSAPGKAGVSVVRVSGPGAFDSFKILAGLKDAPSPRQALFRTLKDPQGGEMIDQALVIAFAAPASFTGENVVEYQLHGSPAVLSALLSALSAFAGHRPAEHGEFTRRAFENGKLDLTEAEAVADLINAETQAQKTQALSQMGGALSRLYDGWRERLVKSLAYVEAVIDFPDEDVPDSETRKAFPAIEQLIAEIKEHLNDNRRGEILRSGVQVAIVGAPNAGKSSLLNKLAQRDVAIVSPMAGTTRDVIEVHLDLGGYPVILADTAGLRPEEVSAEDDGHGSVEYEGIRRAMLRASNADLKILVFDGTQTDLHAHTLDLADEKSIVIFTKSDLPGFKGDTSLPYPSMSLSSQTGENFSRFIGMLTERVQALYGAARETPSLTRARHRAALEESLACLQGSLEAALPELMAEDLRMAARSLGRITGRIDVEDLLDVIFRDFCIGK